MRVVWLSEADRDLDDQIAYIAERDPSAAIAIFDTVVSAVERLSEFPGMGRAGRLSGTREFVIPVTPFVIVYRVRSDRVEVLRVVHGARQWPRA